MQFLLAEDMSMPFMFPGPNLSAYSSLITVYFIEMLGRRRGRGQKVPCLTFTSNLSLWKVSRDSRTESIYILETHIQFLYREI